MQQQQSSIHILEGNCCSCSALAGASLRYAVCHTFSSSFLRSGSSCGLYPTSFISSFVPLHYTRSQLTIFPPPWHTNPHTYPQHKCAHVSGQTRATVLTGFHSPSLRPSFISVAYRPPAAFCCCARLAAPGCVTGRRWHKTYPYKAGALCHTRPLHCVSIAPCGSFTGHPSRGHSQAIPSYLLHCL